VQGLFRLVLIDLTRTQLEQYSWRSFASLCDMYLGKPALDVVNNHITALTVNLDVISPVIIVIIAILLLCYARCKATPISVPKYIVRGLWSLTFYHHTIILLWY
jgi:hypothetical protein